MSKYVWALDSAALRLNGASVSIRRGECRYADDPAVLAHPDLFGSEPLNVAKFPGWMPREADSEVEQATAAPGEKRSVKRGA